MERAEFDEQEKKGKERDRTLVRVAGGVVENRERKGGCDSGGDRLREAQTEEVVGKRKRSLSMSSSGTTISTLRERERERKDGMKEIKRERDREGDKWRQNS